MKYYLLVIDRVRTGGAERILIDYYNYLIKCGHKVDIYVLYREATSSPWLDNLRVTYGSNKEVGASMASKLFTHIKIYTRLLTKINCGKYDVIFTFLEKSNIFSYLSNFKGVKHVCTVHNVLSIQYLKIANPTIKKLWAKAISSIYNSDKTTIIAVSEQVKTDLINNFDVEEENIFVVNNFVDSHAIHIKSREEVTEFNFYDDVSYAINIGRLSDQKNQGSLLYAFSQYLKDNPIENKVHLLIMGEGENEENLRQKIKELKLEEKVTIIDFQVNPYKFLAQCKLLVLSSKFEGFPIVIAETRSLGIPFCGTHYSIPQEMFTSNSAYDMCTFPDLYEIDGVAKFKLIMNSVFSTDTFSEELLAATSEWNSHNDKEYQFKQYCEISINENIHKENNKDFPD